GKLRHVWRLQHARTRDPYFWNLRFQEVLTGRDHIYRASAGNQQRRLALTARKSLGGSPLTPRIAVWRRDPGSRLGVFFNLIAQYLQPTVFSPQTTTQLP